MFDGYTTEAKNFDLYELVEIPDNAEGQLTEETTIVNYVYRLKKGIVTVKFVDKDGNEIADSIILKGSVGTDWETSAIDIEGYFLIGNETATGQFELQNGEIVFVYDVISDEKIEKNVIEKVQTGTAIGIIAILSLGMGVIMLKLRKKIDG